MSKKPSIQPNTRIDRVKVAQLSCSFAANCRTKCYFSRVGQERQQLIPLNSWVYSIKKKHLRDVNVSQTCVSSEKKLILARTGLFGDYEGRNFTICLKYRAQLGVRIQTFGFVNASILLIKIGDIKLREVNLKMAEEIKADGESSWWQGDCKPNRTRTKWLRIYEDHFHSRSRTRTVTAILELAMNKEEGQEERLSEHQFS